MKVSHEWLQSFFDEKLSSPEEVAEALTFGSFEIEGIEQVGNDSVIDIDVLPNRASDCLSHRGIAKEISVLMGKAMTRDPLKEEVPKLSPKTEDFSVTISDANRCSFYGAAVIRGIKIGPSPEWLQKRLEAVGQKSINNVVDATNYVMFELGTPLHAFDSGRISTSIGVRPAKDKEKITVLGGEEKELNENITVITDAISDTPIAIAGVKGGVHAEVSSGTTSIVLEAARFDPLVTRKAAMELNLRTDASKRFENNIANSLPVYGLNAAVVLIEEIAGGECVGFQTAGEAKTYPEEVLVTLAQVNSLLGLSLGEEDVEKVLDRLQFKYTTKEESLTITAPFERTDIQIAEDVIEEIGRVYGYHNISETALSKMESVPTINSKWYWSERVREVLNGLGFKEVLTYALRDTGGVELTNPLAADKGFVRNTLRAGIIDSLALNENNAPFLGLYDAVRVFEIGTVAEGGNEHTSVGVGVRFLQGKNRDKEADDELARIRETLVKELGFEIEETNIRDGVFEWNLTKSVEGASLGGEYPSVPHIQKGITFIPHSIYPCVLRDIALWTPKDFASDTVLSIITKEAGEMLVRADLFDTFEKEDQISYAFHLVFQSYDRTLSDDEVGGIMKKVEEELIRKGCTIR